MNVSVVIVTSPAISNPDTFLIDNVIESLELIRGLETAQIIIILDGYILNDKTQTKKGRINVEMELNYKEYFATLQDKYRNGRFLIKINDSHMGFALSVKRGLELCQTTYALVLQHDRKFIFPFAGLRNLMSCMEDNPHLRYIHFPTIMSMKHTSSLRRYGLHFLTEPEAMYFPIHRDYELRPIIFWYDSNHLCHVKRYLEIYTPYQSIPDTIKEILLSVDSKCLIRMVLKRGDFIEDKFGQVQRNSLVALRDNPSAARQVFRWFGSYMLWHDNRDASTEEIEGEDECEYTNEEEVEKECKCGDCEIGAYTDTTFGCGERVECNDVSTRAPLSTRSCVMVTHLRGRHYAPLYASSFHQHDSEQV